MPPEKNKRPGKRDIMNDLKQRLDKVVDDISKEKGVPRDEIIKFAVEYVNGKK